MDEYSSDRLILSACLFFSIFAFLSVLVIVEAEAQTVERWENQIVTSYSNGTTVYELATPYVQNSLFYSPYDVTNQTNGILVRTAFTSIYGDETTCQVKAGIHNGTAVHNDFIDSISLYKDGVAQPINNEVCTVQWNDSTSTLSLTRTHSGDTLTYSYTLIENATEYNMHWKTTMSYTPGSDGSGYTIKHVVDTRSAAAVHDRNILINNERLTPNQTNARINHGSHTYDFSDAFETATLTYLDVSKSSQNSIILTYEYEPLIQRPLKSNIPWEIDPTYVSDDVRGSSTGSSIVGEYIPWEYTYNKFASSSTSGTKCTGNGIITPSLDITRINFPASTTTDSCVGFATGSGFYDDPVGRIIKDQEIPTSFDIRIRNYGYQTSDSNANWMCTVKMYDPRNPPESYQELVTQG